MVHHRIASDALKGNLLSDPWERDLYVYLPPGYNTSAKRYPSAYLLHPFGSTASEMIMPSDENRRWSPPMEDVLGPVFQRVGVPGMLVVIPDGWTSYGCSQWVDSPVSGRFGEYVTREIVPFVESNYRAISDRVSRGVLGFSSGGFGAWHVASGNPGIFGALAVLSGDSYFDLTHLSMVYDFYESIWPGPPSGPIEENYVSMMVYALASAYSPNPDKPPFYVDLPVDFDSGEIVSGIWAKWLALDPINTVVPRREALTSLAGILLDVGRHDDARLQWGHRVLSSRMREAGIDHEVVEHAGDHSGRSRERYQFALRWLSTKLRFDDG